MKHKKAIEIKDPKLRKIRNNLRLLWVSAVNNILSNYLEEQRDLLALNQGKKMNSFDLDQYAKLNRESERLRSILNRSICECPACRRSDQDMIFNPVTKVWFFVHCYELNREYYRHTNDGKFYP